MNKLFQLNTVAWRVIATWAIPLTISVVMSMPGLLRSTAVWAAEPSNSSLISKVPLREGLMIAAPYHDPASGDHEGIWTITKIDAKAVTVTLSADEPSECVEEAGTLETRRTITRRSILRVDLEAAHAYRQEFPECALEPKLYPGMTGFSVSSSVLRNLSTKKQTNLTLTGSMDPLPGVLTRIEPESMPFKVTLNDEPVKVAAVHARWHSSKFDAEFWILDDLDNPLVLRWSHNGKTFFEVAKLSFPTEQRSVRLEQDLSDQGRTVVYGIYFNFASDQIKDESEPALKDIADIMTKNPTWRLAVLGHTDSLGGTEANLQLSRRRAAAVSKALSERYKIAPTRLKPTGFGETKPKATNETLEGRALNRRVELVRMGR